MLAAAVCFLWIYRSWSCFAQCSGVLAEALGANWKAAAKRLIQPMVQTGLSSELGCTMTKVIAYGKGTLLFCM